MFFFLIFLLAVDLEAYLRISSKLKLGGTGLEHVLKSISAASLPAKSSGEMDIAGQLITGMTTTFRHSVLLLVVSLSSASKFAC